MAAPTIAGNTQLNPNEANGNFIMNGATFHNSLTTVKKLTTNVTYAAPLNTLLFLTCEHVNDNKTNAIKTGYTISSIGPENFIIVPTPKFDTTALNTQTSMTITSYFNLPFVAFEKYSPVAEVKPIDVVKHAKDTIIHNNIFPGLPRSAEVISTINSACDVFTSNLVDNVAPK